MFDKSKAPMNEDNAKNDQPTRPLTEVKIYQSQDGFDEPKKELEDQNEDAQMTALAE